MDAPIRAEIYRLPILHGDQRGSGDERPMASRLSQRTQHERGQREIQQYAEVSKPGKRNHTSVAAN